MVRPVTGAFCLIAPTTFDRTLRRQYFSPHLLFRPRHLTVTDTPLTRNERNSSRHTHEGILPPRSVSFSGNKKIGKVMSKPAVNNLSESCS